MQLLIEVIELDETIQCRAVMEQDTIDEYAEAMGNGDDFPPIEVFGTKKKCWLGDGWYRVSAARKLGLAEIKAELHTGGRTEAIKHALQANAKHGNRRTNEDKRWAVQIALREFSKLSNRAIAEMCAVGHGFVNKERKQVDLGSTPPQAPKKSKENGECVMRIGRDGVERPVARKKNGRQAPVDMAGKKYGDLIFIKPAKVEKSKSRHAMWEALCERCGETKIVDAALARSGKVKNCGCKKTNIRAKVQKRKMIEILSDVRGVCRSLPSINLEYLFLVCTKKELKEWAKTAKDLAKQLNVFSKRLIKGGE